MAPFAVYTNMTKYARNYSSNFGLIVYSSTTATLCLLGPLCNNECDPGSVAASSYSKSCSDTFFMMIHFLMQETASASLSIIFLASKLELVL